MSEKMMPAEAYVVHKECSCGGEMARENPDMVLLTDPAQYSHKCTKCGRKENYFKSYPYTKIIENKGKSYSKNKPRKVTPPAYRNVEESSSDCKHEMIWPTDGTNPICKKCGYSEYSRL